jgi:hypothetical protein
MQTEIPRLSIDSGQREILDKKPDISEVYPVVDGDINGLIKNRV